MGKTGGVFGGGDFNMFEIKGRIFKLNYGNGEFWELSGDQWAHIERPQELGESTNVDIFEILGIVFMFNYSSGSTWRLNLDDLKWIAIEVKPEEEK